jgi:hypothetical protein
VVPLGRHGLSNRGQVSDSRAPGAALGWQPGVARLLDVRKSDSNAARVALQQNSPEDVAANTEDHAYEALRIGLTRKTQDKNGARSRNLTPDKKRQKMNEEQLTQILRNLAHELVRNEIVCEHFLTQQLPVSGCEIGAKVREVDRQLGEYTDWQNRFPGLFPEGES